MKTKILLVLILIFAFVYWRGAKSILTKMGLDCNWHAVYAVCLTDSKKVKDGVSPDFMDIIKAGWKF